MSVEGRQDRGRTGYTYLLACAYLFAYLHTTWHNLLTAVLTLVHRQSLTEVAAGLAVMVLGGHERQAARKYWPTSGL